MERMLVLLEIFQLFFLSGKNLGAMGDAGAILTNNEKLQEDCAKFARHGGLKEIMKLRELIVGWMVFKPLFCL